jgi:dTDP-4-amino-4,6-dideoxygalactose transaminase
MDYDEQGGRIMSRIIQSNDFTRQWAEVGPDVLRAVDRVGKSGWYVLGSEVERFEAALAAYWGQRAHACGVGSGLDAVEIGLRTLGCGAGDYVLTTPLSAFATTLAIVRLGAIPVFVDTDEIGLIDLARCHEVLRARREIRYFVPVHLYGHALDRDGLEWLRDAFDLKIVEDCAQSAGATSCGQATGTVGQIAATSFYPTKNLGAMGDGGALLTNDADLYKHARRLRFYGESGRYQHAELGYNSRLDEVQAALLHDAFLPRLNGWVARRREIAAAYSDGIQNREVCLPGKPKGSDSSWHLFPIHVAPNRRDALQTHLQVAGIPAGIHYPTAIPDQTAMAQARFELADDCSMARQICASELSLPIHPYLTDQEVQQIITAVNSFERRETVAVGTTA